MNLLTGLLAQLLHIALSAAAAPTLIGVRDWLEARVGRRLGPSLLKPWHDLARLARKHPVVAESASPVTEFGPIAAVAAIAVAVCLVPSFSLGMTFAPFADVVVIAGLLAVARCSLALAAMDAGSAPGGVGASRTMLLACASDAALLLVAFGLGLLAGSLDIDVIAGLRQEAGLHAPIAAMLALAAMVAVAATDAGVIRDEAMFSEFSARDLALLELAGALRLLLWFNLIGALFLPFGMAPPGGGPMAWLIGLVCWLARMLLFTAAVAAVRAVLGRMRLVRTAQMLGVAVALAVLALLFLFAGMVTA